MKQFTIILCLIVLPIIAKSQKSSEKVLIDQVVAVVGSNVILYSEIENEFIQSALNPTIDMEDELEESFIRQKGYTPTIKVASVDKLQNTYGRYETTIENRLYKAMHELERIQRMRKGEKISAPLAVDVNEMGSFGEK